MGYEEFVELFEQFGENMSPESGYEVLSKQVLNRFGIEWVGETSEALNGQILANYLEYGFTVASTILSKYSSYSVGGMTPSSMHQFRTVMRGMFVACTAFAKGS